MANITFKQKPSPVLPEHRPIYKMAQAVCIIGYTGRGSKASTLKINLINWALHKKERQKILVEACAKKTIPFAAWGFDPALAIALLLCEAESLTLRTHNGHELTDKGKVFFERIDKDGDLLNLEKEFLKSIGKKLTEELIENESKNWGKHEDQSI